MLPRARFSRKQWGLGAKKGKRRCAACVAGTEVAAEAARDAAAGVKRDAARRAAGATKAGVRAADALAAAARETAAEAEAVTGLKAVSTIETAQTTTCSRRSNVR